jgi:hypothetical protein
MSAEAEVIRKEAMRRYMNDPLHRARTQMACDLIEQPADVSEQARQLVRTGALIASSLALVLADTDFMASIEAQVEATRRAEFDALVRMQSPLSDEQRKQLLLGDWTPQERIADISDMPQA